MAKDDYNKIVCIILTYLYARLKGKTEERPEVYLQPFTKDFPVEEDYFNFIIESMIEKKYISGVAVVKAWGGDIIKIMGISRIKITADGIQYLSENKTMRQTLEWLRDNAITLPGMVSTVIGILQN